jgi:hypothetical protein
MGDKIGRQLCFGLSQSLFGGGTLFSVETFFKYGERWMRGNESKTRLNVPCITRRCHFRHTKRLDEAPRRTREVPKGPVMNLESLARTIQQGTQGRRFFANARKGQ